MLPPTANPTLGYIALLTVKSATSPTRPGAIPSLDPTDFLGSSSSSLTTLIGVGFGLAFILSTASVTLSGPYSASDIANCLDRSSGFGGFCQPVPRTGRRQVKCWLELYRRAGRRW